MTSRPKKNVLYFAADSELQIQTLNWNFQEKYVSYFLKCILNFGKEWGHLNNLKPEDAIFHIRNVAND